MITFLIFYYIFSALFVFGMFVENKHTIISIITGTFCGFLILPIILGANIKL